MRLKTSRVGLICRSEFRPGGRQVEKLRKKRLGEEMSFQARMEETVGQVDSRLYRSC